MEWVYDEQKRPLLICSEGGHTDVGRALYDIVRAVGRPTVGMGLIASAALPVFAAATERWASPTAIFVHHEPYLPGGQNDKSWYCSEVEECARSLSLDYQWICSALGSVSASDEYWRECGSGGGRVFTAEEAMELGLVTKILSLKEVRKCL
jgi:ATP-dependent protease ClpP protease subunit